MRTPLRRSAPALQRFRAPRATRSTALHPGAWWLWALGLAAAASRTTNPLLLALLIAVAGYVVAARRTDAPWARSYGAFLKLGLFVLAIRLVFAFFLGSPIPGTHTVVTLPELPLPDWAQGVRIGGRVTAEGLLFALYDGLKLATLLICVGAANALANPARLLKSLPGALYEAGVAVVVAMTFAPNLIADVRRLRSARRLRGRSDRGAKALLQVGLPVLEGALERSVALAAAMDARGYGRTASVPRAVRHTTTALTLGGLLAVCAGTYGLLAADGGPFGLPLLLGGAALALCGLWLGGRRTLRTRYRPDRLGVRAWLVAVSGAAVAAAMTNGADSSALHPPAMPLTAPGLPLGPAVAILLGLLPAFVAPLPETSRTRSGRDQGPAGRPGSPGNTDTTGGTGGTERPGRSGRRSGGRRGDGRGGTGEHHSAQSATPRSSGRTVPGENSSGVPDEWPAPERGRPARSAGEEPEAPTVALGARLRPYRTWGTGAPGPSVPPHHREREQ